MNVICGLVYTRMAATLGRLFVLNFRYLLPYVLLIVCLTFRLTRVAPLIGVPLAMVGRTKFRGNSMFMVIFIIK